ncbi:MAG: hypothetical protein KatS3mg053_2050 [Candidatus Roseilinea sp.]|jgi:hypothetical protein|nr:MAG: hypothetical protein KatS3mg053_2050 [Candidatus Roseilinea sp.]
MSALFSDTHPEAEALQIALWRQAGPAHKMNMLAQLNASARTLALVGLIHRAMMFNVDVFIPSPRPFL